MIITINGDSIEYTLEDENNAGDVLNGLTSWLEGSDLVPASLSLNGAGVLLTDTEWRARPVDEIDRMELEAIGVRESRIRQLETARDYFILLNNAVEADESEALAELSEGYGDLLRILPNLLGEERNPSIITHLRNTMETAGFPIPDGEKLMDRDLLSKESARIAYILEGRRQETENPAAEAASAAEALSALAEKLDDVAVHLQTGKDKQAMETIIVLTEMLQRLMRALSWSESRFSGEKIADDMTGILAELEEALKVSDTVLIGDLLEYEIKPRLLELPNRLSLSGEAAT